MGREVDFPFQRLSSDVTVRGPEIHDLGRTIFFESIEVEVDQIIEKAEIDATQTKQGQIRASLETEFFDSAEEQFQANSITSLTQPQSHFSFDPAIGPIPDPEPRQIRSGERILLEKFMRIQRSNLSHREVLLGHPAWGFSSARSRS